jgi:tRNA(fMet)-specific endonuclease VapC
MAETRPAAMIVLDSDHLSVLGDPTPAWLQLLQRLDASGEEVATTVVNVEESLRGWLALIHRAASVQAEVFAYQRFQNRVAFFAEWMVLPYDEEAAQRFRRLRAQRLRTGTNDLRVACIALEHDVLLLTRNEKDFVGVPDLRFENWLD